MTAGFASVAVWSPKGGVGKSILATALALRLSERQRTVLIDGNADNPDVASLLQCPGHPNVTGWIDAAAPEQVESMLVRYSDRLWVLPGPSRYIEEDTFTGPIMESVISSCQQAKMTVVVDLGTALRDSTVAALDAVDRILVPVTLDLLSVAPLRRIQRELDLLRLPASKFQVVINRFTSTREIVLEDVQGFSAFPIAGTVPSSRELAAAVNTGEVAAALAGNSPVGKEVARLAEPFLDGSAEAAPEPAQKGLLGGLFKGLRKGGG